MGKNQIPFDKDYAEFLASMVNEVLDIGVEKACSLIVEGKLVADSYERIKNKNYKDCAKALYEGIKARSTYDFYSRSRKKYQEYRLYLLNHKGKSYLLYFVYKDGDTDHCKHSIYNGDVYLRPHMIELKSPVETFEQALKALIPKNALKDSKSVAFSGGYLFQGVNVSTFPKPSINTIEPYAVFNEYAVLLLDGDTRLEDGVLYAKEVGVCGRSKYSSHSFLENCPFHLNKPQRIVKANYKKIHWLSV